MPNILLQDLRQRQAPRPPSPQTSVSRMICTAVTTAHDYNWEQRLCGQIMLWICACDGHTDIVVSMCTVQIINTGDLEQAQWKLSSAFLPHTTATLCVQIPGRLPFPRAGPELESILLTCTDRSCPPGSRSLSKICCCLAHRST